VTLLNYRADGTPFWNERWRSRPERDGARLRSSAGWGTQRDVTDPQCA